VLVLLGDMSDNGFVTEEDTSGVGLSVPLCDKPLRLLNKPFVWSIGL